MTDTKFRLFLFDGEGTSGSGEAGEGSGNVAGVTAGAAGQQNDLGIPKAAMEKWAKSREKRGLAAIAAAPAETGGAAAKDGSAENTAEGDANPTSAMSWEQIKNDPKYKADIDRYVTGIVKNRLAKSKATEQAMQELTPALVLLRNQYGIAEGDNAGLVKAITESNRSRIARSRAEELGIDVETAEKLVKAESEAEEAKAEGENRKRQEQLKAHFENLYRQAEELKGKYPGFDIETEFNNPDFVRWTAPDIGMSVEQAYYAVHHAELEQARQQERESKAIEQVTQNVRAGQGRPRENGVSTSAGITKPLYSQMNRQQREQALRFMQQRAAAGGKGNYMDM